MVLVGIKSESGRIAGQTQLYSKARGVSQSLEGHAASFGTYLLEGNSVESKLYTFAVRSLNGAKLHIVEVDPQQGATPFQKKTIDIYFPPDTTQDFPVALHVSQKYKVIYLITKVGFIHIYDLETGTTIYMNRISNDTVFTTCMDSDSAGVVSINRKGQVFHTCIDDTKVVNYLLNSANVDLALSLASRAGLPGAENLYHQKFTTLVNQGNYQEAAKVAAESPGGFLRTPDTIRLFKSAPATSGQLSAILQYFGILLNKGSLNRFESIELVKPVLEQNRSNLLEKWLKEEKLECSEELGDVVLPHNANYARVIYTRAHCHPKVISALAT